MPTTNWFVVMAVLCGMLMLVAQSQAGCVCGQEGTDHCARCSEHTIVRPKSKRNGETPIELPPIGDNCWCNKMSIEPAALPKPCQKHNTPYCKCKNEKAYGTSYGGTSYASHGASSYGASAYDASGYGASTYGASSYGASSYGGSIYDSAPVYNNPPMNYYSPPSKPKDDSSPADPVSVSLAIQAGKAIGVPEAKLAFGFVQKPLDGLTKVEFSNVPEENLFKLKSEVITLKKQPAPVKKYEEEIIIEEEDEEEGSADDDEKPHLTYKQLGYDTEEYKNPKFRKISSAYAAYADEGYGNEGYGGHGSGYGASGYRSKPVYGKTKVDCGFRPGRVTAYHKPGKTCAAGDCYD